MKISSTEDKKAVSVKQISVPECLFAFREEKKGIREQCFCFPEEKFSLPEWLFCLRDGLFGIREGLFALPTEKEAARSAFLLLRKLLTPQAETWVRTVAEGPG